jgi:hypothetical protein
MSRKWPALSGNGKIDRTPHPVGIRKIKRVGFNVFCYLKELVYNVNARVKKPVVFRGDRKRSSVEREKPDIVKERHVDGLEPGQATRLFNSSPRRWNRVNQWHEYINDSGKTNKRDTY